MKSRGGDDGIFEIFMLRCLSVLKNEILFILKSSKLFIFALVIYRFPKSPDYFYF
jgi:hypothetical protein